MSSLENSTQMFKEKHQSIQSLAKMEKGILPNSFYKAIITLIQKKKKSIQKKKKTTNQYPSRV